MPAAADLSIEERVDLTEIDSDNPLDDWGSDADDRYATAIFRGMDYLSYENHVLGVLLRSRY